MPAKTFLVDTHPDIAAEWHPTKNPGLVLGTVATYSNRKVWWLHRDARGDLHQWQQVVRNRAYTGSGCTTCKERPGYVRPFHAAAPGYSIADTHPDIAAQWHPHLNDRLTTADVKAYSKRRAWWRCDAGHDFTATVVAQAILNHRCPECRATKDHSPRKGVIPLTSRPDLVAEWHPTKNGDLRPEAVGVASNHKVWWQGSGCGHVWRAHVHLRAKGTGCPTCVSKRKRGAPSAKGKIGTLAARHPRVAAQWHPTMNGDLTAADVTASSGLPYWWLCPDGHTWRQSPTHRVRRGDVPVCWACSRPTRVAAADQPTARSGSLASEHPGVAAWWHPSRNGHVTPADVRPSAAVKVWWQCPQGHQWQAAPDSRVHSGTGCRRCSNRSERNARPDVLAETPLAA